MVAPGLLMETPAPLEAPDISNCIFVLVKMMCGCPVTTGIPKSYWVESDFIVSAEIVHKCGEIDTQILSFTSDATPSLFHAKVDDFENITQVNFTAKQTSTGNIGYLSVVYPR